jgi:hypothetical protein
VLERLKNDRTRTVLLNATLFVLFGFAWLSDRWPELATTAILSACAFVAFEVILLFNFSRRDEPDAKDGAVEAAKPQATANARSNLPVASPKAFPNDEALKDALYSEILESQSQALRALQRHRAHLLTEAYLLHEKNVATYLLRWTTAHSREARFKFLVAVKELDRRQPRLAELEKWRLLVQGDEFNVAAGAFEIEHFHGRTNIRVLDTSRVTVETGKRGVSLPDAVPGLALATYQ